MSAGQSPEGYTKLFDPGPPRVASTVTRGTPGSDLSNPDCYVFEPSITLAINIALANGRPVLLRGASGSGKSSLARAVAARLSWSYVQIVMTSRTQARDLLWQVDHLRRLQDAQLGRLGADEAAYITPGPLFWAFEPDVARSLLRRTGRLAQTPPSIVAGANTVVLIDEIDKADPDVPNNLLESLGSLSFTVDELNLPIVAARPPLTLVTTNEERDLPPAFLRRCVALKIEPPSPERLMEIGRLHLPDLDEMLISSVAALITGRSRQSGMPPSVAEYLDMLRACDRLGVAPDSQDFTQVARMTLWKSDHIDVELG